MPQTTNNITLPKSIKEGILKIGSIELKVHVLNDGRRIIEADSMDEFMKYLENGGTFSDQEATDLAKFCKGL